MFIYRAQDCCTKMDSLKAILKPFYVDTSMVWQQTKSKLDDKMVKSIFDTVFAEK